MKNKYVLARGWEVTVVGTIHDTTDALTYDVLINVLWCVKGVWQSTWYPKQRWFHSAEVTALEEL